MRNPAPFRQLILMLMLSPGTPAHALPPDHDCDARATRQQLEQLYSTDQSIRTNRLGALETSLETDRANVAALERIIDLCGWPERSRFGRKAALGTFLVVQHADLPAQLKYLPAIRGADRRSELIPGTLPLLEDRIRVRQGRPQLYGSQVDPGSGWPLPVEDPENLDRRRLSMGMSWYCEY